MAGCLASLLMAAGAAGLSLVGAKSTPTATASTSIVGSMPANVQSGDVLIAVMVGANSATWTQPGGWSEAVDDSNIAISTRTAGGSEPSSYTFTASASTTATVTILAFRGCTYDGIGAFGAYGSSGAPTITAPSRTQVGGGITLAICYVLVSGGTFTTPTGCSLISAYSVSGFGSTIYVYSKAANAGATGNISNVGSNGAGLHGRAIQLGLAKT